MQTKKSNVIILSTVLVLSLATALIYLTANNKPSIEPTPTLSPSPVPTPTVTAPPTSEPKTLEIDVKVTPWGDMYRKEPDTKTDFNVELVHPNNNTHFTTDTFNVTFNAGAFYWIVEKAYYTSDLFSGERWIAISKNQYTQDLQKTFTFNLTKIPQGSHYLTLTVIFHEGTRNNSTAYFNVNNS